MVGVQNLFSFCFCFCLFLNYTFEGMCLCFCVYILFMNIETRIILKLISKKIKRICIKKLERYDHYDLILLYVALIRKMFCTLELDLGHIKTRSWRWLKRLCADYPPSSSILPCLATTKYCHSGDIGFQIATWPHVGHEVKGPWGFKGDFTLKVVSIMPRLVTCSTVVLKIWWF